MDKLRLCPFCGNAARLHVSNNGVKVMCTECGCSTPTYDDVSNFNPFAWGENKNKNAVELVIEKMESKVF